MFVKILNKLRTVQLIQMTWPRTLTKVNAVAKNTDQSVTQLKDGFNKARSMSDLLKLSRQ